jgi:hypothetical protein
MTCKSSLEKNDIWRKATTLKHQIALPVIHKVVAWIIQFAHYLWHGVIIGSPSFFKREHISVTIPIEPAGYYLPVRS